MFSIRIRIIHYIGIVSCVPSTLCLTTPRFTQLVYSWKGFFSVGQSTVLAAVRTHYLLGFCSIFISFISIYNLHECSGWVLNRLLFRYIQWSLYPTAVSCWSMYIAICISIYYCNSIYNYCFTWLIVPDPKRRPMRRCFFAN